MKSIAKNYFFNLFYQILVVILPVVTAPYLSRVLGVDRIGEYSFVQSIVSYFSLFAALGTALYGQRRIAQCSASNEPYRQTFEEIVLLRFLGVGVALAVYFALIFRGADNRLLYAVAAIETLAVAFDISWFYQGIEQFQNITLCSGISKLAGAASIFVFVKARGDLELFVLLYCGATLLGNIAQWLFVGSYLRGGPRGKLRLTPHVVPTLRLFLPQFAIQAYTMLDKTMIGLITGSNFENGYYEQSQKVVKILLTIVTSIGAVMTSRIAILWNSDDEDRDEQIQNLLLFSFRLVFALGLPIMAGVVVIASRFIPLFLGPGYEPCIALTRLLTVLIPVIGCSNVIGMQLFVPSGRENLLTRSVVAGAVVNILLNAFMIRAWEARGAVYASIIAECVVTGVQFYYARREIPAVRVLGLFVRYFALAGAMGVVGYLLARFVGMGWVGLCVIIAVCAGLYGGALLLLKDPILELVGRKR